jgi:hypothetical protein
MNMHKRLSKSQLFETLPGHLSAYNNWLPGFKLVDGPVNSVHVVFRVKSDAVAREIHQLQDDEKGLAREWWMSVLLPAVHSLPEETKTRRFNTPATYQATRILPRFLRLYSEDLPLLHGALHDATMDSSFHHHLTWNFVCSRYGQRLEVTEGEILGPEAFRLPAMFDLSREVIVSIHLAMNFTCRDKTMSLFWHRTRTAGWSTSTSEFHFVVIIVNLHYISTERGHHVSFPLFGLTELANVHVHTPRSSVVEAATGGRVTFLQHYTPMVKSMQQGENPVRDMLLMAHPHLLTYLLGTGYVSKRPKFKRIWEEVNTQRTLHEILEAVHPSVPFEARMEVVITDRNLSFLSSFRHEYVARAAIRDGLLVKVGLQSIVFIIHGFLDKTTSHCVCV